MHYFIKITGKLCLFFCVNPNFLEVQDPGVMGRNTGSISGISTVRDHPFQYHCFDVSWIVPMNRKETTWLASRIPPFSCYYAITHSSAKFSLPSTMAHRFNAGVQPLLCFTTIQKILLRYSVCWLKIPGEDDLPPTCMECHSSSVIWDTSCFQKVFEMKKKTLSASRFLLYLSLLVFRKATEISKQAFYTENGFHIRDSDIHDGFIIPS